MVDAGILDAEIGVELLRRGHLRQASGVLEPSEQFYRLSVDQYHAMVDAGHPHGRRPGRTPGRMAVAKMTKNPPHTIATELALDALSRIMPAGWYRRRCSSRSPRVDSEPRARRRCRPGHAATTRIAIPAPRDVALSSRSPTRASPTIVGSSSGIYARAGFAIYWIVNLVDRQIEVHTEPSGPAESPGYARREVFGPDDEIPSSLIEAARSGRIAVCDLLALESRRAATFDGSQASRARAPIHGLADADSGLGPSP